MLLLAIAGCSGKPGAEDVVRSALKDPGSAEFEGVVEREVDGVRVACGRVNAKNALGGYVGARPFMVYGGQLWLAQTEAEAFAVTACCGLRITTSRSAEEKTAGLAMCTPDLPDPMPAR